MTELDVATEAAERAASIIREHYRRDFAVRDKADGTPVTEVDEACEVAIREVIAARYPGDAIHGEEQGRSGEGERLWLVDPIDGTKSFVRGYPMLSVQIALMDRDELVLGVSCAPVYGGGETAVARRGGGATLGGAPLAVSAVRELARATLSTGNLRSLAGSPGWAALGGIVSTVDRIRGYGDFLHYHLLASGRLDAVVESDLNILDIAALTVIVREAGGVVTDLQGGEVGLGTTSILATNGHLHEDLLRRLAGEGPT